MTTPRNRWARVLAGLVLGAGVASLIWMAIRYGVTIFGATP